MYREHRVIVVTPAGRRRYLEILIAYLLRQRGIVDEYHLWANTRDADDLAYIDQLAHAHPGFVKVVRKPLFSDDLPWNIWQYFRDYCTPGTLYIRLDDDICYMAPDAVAAMLDFRIDNPKPFLVLGNVVNNAQCAVRQQAAGAIPRRFGRVTGDCFDLHAWRRGRFAERLHRRFIADVRAGRVRRWRIGNHELADYSRFSINAICWWGEDMGSVAEVARDDLGHLSYRSVLSRHQPMAMDEEQFLSAVLPARLNRPNVICGDAVFGHFAFFTQREYLEAATDILPRYKALALDAADPSWWADLRRKLALLRRPGLVYVEFRRYAKAVLGSLGWIPPERPPEVIVPPA